MFNCAAGQSNGPGGLCSFTRIEAVTLEFIVRKLDGAV
jgi:hypothetical protein